ncbi:hypothetical protein [Streptomyces sp. NPDC048309]|uniref:hypothetical protein n=1 Tax=Streptomyces sp. NPDC048309 TaxID=3154618 RepID=UPI003407F66C
MSTSRSSPGPDADISPGAQETPSEPRHDDPLDALVHAAVVDRPLEEVIQLITLLEQSPANARTTVDALRAAGMDRSVEDVGRLVALLAAPPRSPDSADEAIRAAAESRPVEDVTRLMVLLHRSSVESHCAQEAVRTAAARRPVEELVQLMGRLTEESAGGDGPGEEPSVRAPGSAASSPLEDSGPTPEGSDRRTDSTPDERAAPPVRARRELSPERNATLPSWSRWLTAAALLGCGVAYGPQHRNGASLGVYSLAVGAFALCAVLAAAVFLRGTVALLGAAVLAPATLATLQFLEGRLHSPGLSRALEIGAAPPMTAGLAAVIATLAALTALLAARAADRSDRLPAARAPVGVDRAAD